MQVQLLRGAWNTTTSGPGCAADSTTKWETTGMGESGEGEARIVGAGAAGSYFAGGDRAGKEGQGRVGVRSSGGLGLGGVSLERGVESQCQRSGQELGTWKAPWPTGARSFLKLPRSLFTVFVRSFPRCQVGLHRKESAGALGGRRPGAVTLPCEICLRSWCSSRDPCNVVCYDQTTTCVHPKSDYLNHDDSAPISNSHGSLSDVGIFGRCVCAYTCLPYRVTILLVAVCLPSLRSGGKGGRGV